MPPRQKRPREIIDLTDGDLTPPRTKNPRTTASAGQSTYYSNSQSSQPTQSSQRPTWQQRDDTFAHDEPEVLDLTQPDDEPALALYGTIDNKIVGCRYYDGIVSVGEVVVLRREPSNQ